MIETMRSHTGRYLAEDDTRVNLADELRGMPINIGRGEKPGAKSIMGFGETFSDIASTTLRDFWYGPTALQPIPPADGLQLYAASTSSEDASGGTGCRRLRIEYIDAATGVAAAEELAMDGLTPVPLANSAVRFVQFQHSVEVGSHRLPVGEITIVDAGGTVYSHNPADSNMSISALRMVPGGRRLFITSAKLSVMEGDALARMRSNSRNGATYQNIRLYYDSFSVGVGGSDVTTYSPPMGPFPEYTIILPALIENTKKMRATFSWNGFYEML